jgi:DNA-binding MarR family transcriptional regulator
VSRGYLIGTGVTDIRASVDTGQLLLSGSARLHRLQVELLAQLEQPLTLRQFRLLQRIDEGVTSMTDLSRLARRSLPTISESVEGMIRRGLLTRAASEADRRAAVLQVTTAGRQALEDARSTFDQFAADILATVPASKQRDFATFTQLVYDFAGLRLWGEDNL